MRLRIVLVALILALTGLPAWGADTVTTNIFCQSRATVENYADLMEAESGRKAATILLTRDLESGECARYPIPQKVDVEERGTPRDTTFEVEKEIKPVVITPIRVRQFWGLEIIILESA